MNDFDDDDKIFDDADVTPMLDLSYVLLVIFIILTTASVQGIEVNLPQASDKPSLSEPKTKAVSIASDGTIYLDAYPVSLEQLESLLLQYKAVDPDLPVVIKADAMVQYQSVVDVLDVIGKADIRQLGLVTQKLVK